jgi:nucleoside-diphosphate-sugar epimerase
MRESKPLPVEFVDEYAASKAVGEVQVLGANCAAFRTCALRPSIIYGADDNFIASKLLHGKFSWNNVIVGDGTNWLDYVHVHDVARAHVLAEAALSAAGAGAVPTAALPAPCGRVYFIGAGEPITQREFVCGADESRGSSAALFPPPPPCRTHWGLTRPMWLPVSLGWALAAVNELIWGCFRFVAVNPGLSRASLDFLIRPWWAKTDAARAELGWAPTLNVFQIVSQMRKDARGA